MVNDILNVNYPLMLKYYKIIQLDKDKVIINLLIKKSRRGFYEKNFKKLALTLGGVLSLGILLPALNVGAYELNSMNNICTEDAEEHTEVCLETTTTEENSRAIVIPLVVKGIASALGFSSQKASEVASHWRRHDSRGYNNYYTALNNGQYHCQNMCSNHNAINPSNYGLTNTIIWNYCCK